MVCHSVRLIVRKGSRHGAYMFPSSEPSKSKSRAHGLLVNLPRHITVLLYTCVSFCGGNDYKCRRGMHNTMRHHKGGRAFASVRADQGRGRDATGSRGEPKDAADGPHSFPLSQGVPMCRFDSAPLCACLSPRGWCVYPFL